MKENFFKGFAIGIVVPIIAFYFYVTLVLKIDLKPGIDQLLQTDLFSPVFSISILANVLPLFVYNNRQENEKVRGVVAASIIYAFIISVMYFL